MTLSHCKISCEATVIKINVVKQKDRKISQWNRRKSPEIDPYSHLIGKGTVMVYFVGQLGKAVVPSCSVKH